MTTDTKTGAERPDDVETLLLRLSTVESERDALKLLVLKLRAQIARRNRKLFGSTSERFGDAQASLLEGPTLDELAAAAPRPVRPRDTAANAAAVDRSLPPELPREAQVYRPDTTDGHHDANGQSCGCTNCGGRLRQIGAEVSEQLEYVPARFKMIRHVRPRLACTHCEVIVQAPAPARPIARGLAGPALLAQVLVSKYADHLPLYRQSRIYARSGVEIERATMAGWVGQTEAVPAPLLAALGRYVMAPQKLHADDTPVKVLAPGAGRARTGRLWVYVRDDRPAGSVEPPAAWYRYSPDRRGEHPRQHLAGFAGVLQADADGGWGGVYESGRVTEAACWAHARRPWWDLHEREGRRDDTLAAEALRRIGAL